VVADEVKQLAQETARATGDITAQVEAIQKDSAAARDAILRIGEVIGRIDNYQSSIASAVEKQSGSTRETARSIADAANGSSQIAGVMRTIADDTETSAGGLTRISDAINALSETVTQLRSAAGRFQV
jgi:methyl-accepting chemotaxis protein